MAVFGKSHAELALNLICPLVEEFLVMKWIRRKDFHLIISRRESNGYTILVERSFGDIDECLKKYGPIAEGKTEISARTGLSSREVQLMRPDLLEEDDVLFWGSAIEGDIIVAGSGVQPWVDEAISKSCLAICMALTQESFEKAKETAVRDGMFRYR